MGPGSGFPHCVVRGRVVVGLVVGGGNVVVEVEVVGDSPPQPKEMNAGTIAIADSNDKRIETDCFMLVHNPRDPG
jgi:hypothetical protein